jgi:hypothetical protein
MRRRTRNAAPHLSEAAGRAMAPREIILSLNRLTNVELKRLVLNLIHVGTL